MKENGGVFQKFEYHGDPFGGEEEINKRYQKIQKSKQIAGPFVAPQNLNKMKFEYPFLARGEEYTYDFLNSEDPYSISTDDRLRAKWIEEAR